AEEALVNIGSKAVDKLIEALVGSDDEKIRRNVTLALGKIGDPKAVDGLIRALGDTDCSVIRNAEEALVNIGSKAVDKLIEALVGSDDEEIRRKAAWTLGKIVIRVVK
ncbi:MAG TPA: HEAT repeat domain-containing protein, partial [Candidatus Paceibacterota bacterium]|nr:HEAT repeat domain-containing protein [Candidatus Paceibacterota bacterium]